MVADDYMHDTEDKQWWMRAGQMRRVAFAELIAPTLGLPVELNPANDADHTQAELFVGGVPCDLQCPTTPFFKAEELYGIPVKHAVTWNRVDYQRYLDGGGGIDLLWWVHWDETQKVIGRRPYSTAFLTGVWRVPYEAIAERIRSGKTPLHVYKRRVGDKRGNAKESYILDLRRFERLTPDGWVGRSPSDFDPTD